MPENKSANAQVLVYGCYGYTGELIVAEGLRTGLRMKLAGRNAEKVAAMAKETGLPFAIADLDKPEQLDSILQDVCAVLHCSGPFIHTWQPMAEACLRMGVHYMDITGEIPVFEALHNLDMQAKQAGVQLMPGVGFDVVPTDCLSAWLKNEVQDAESLELVIFNIGGRTSRGTSLTMIESLGSKGTIRRNGILTEHPVAAASVRVDFGRGPKTAVSLPWGDVSTAYYTTGIPNITTYFVLPPAAVRFLKWSNRLSWLLGAGWVKAIGRNQIKNGKAGPDEHERAESKTLIWGRVKGPNGRTSEKQISLGNGYSFTAESAVHIAHKVAQGKFKPGFQTPAGAYGFGLLNEIVGEKVWI